MPTLFISPRILAKISAKNPAVNREEIEQCFATRCAPYMVDEREEHATDPPTRWFIGETDFGRKLKISFVVRGQDVYLKSAYTANSKSIEEYEAYVNGKT